MIPIPFMPFAEDAPGGGPPPTAPGAKPPAGERAAGRTLEFLGAWSFVAALLTCPWLSAAALTDTERFAPATATTLWMVCLGFLVVGVFALFAFVRKRTDRGESARRAAAGFAGHTAVTLAVLIVAFVVADMTLGRLLPMPASAYLDVPKAQLYGWAYAPRQSIEIVDPDTAQTYTERANREGWRDVEHSAAKSRPRVLLLGDSILFGVGVPREQTVGRQLQHLLGDRFEVIAVGMPAWGTDQELLFLEHEGWKYQPDLVILMFTLANDVRDNMSDHWSQGTAPKPRFLLVGDRLERQPLKPWRPSWRRRLFGRSAICRRLRFWHQMRGLDPGDFQFSYAPQPPGRQSAQAAPDRAAEATDHDFARTAIVEEQWSERLTQGWRLTLRLIEEMALGCRRHGARFVLYVGGQLPPGEAQTVLPATVTDQGKTYRLDPEKPFRLLTEFCRDKAIPYLEERVEFRRDFWQGRLIFRNDAHPNAVGNQRIAENIAQWLTEHNFLDTTGTLKAGAAPQ